MMDPTGAERPLERQVFQRNRHEHGSVVVAGGVPSGADRIEAKAELTAEATRGKAVEWKKASKGW